MPSISVYGALGALAALPVAEGLVLVAEIGSTSSTSLVETDGVSPLGIVSLNVEFMIRPLSWWTPDPGAVAHDT